MGEEEATLAETPCKLEVDGQFPTELRGTLRLTASGVTHVLLEGKQRRYPIGTVLRVEKHDQHRFWKKAGPCVELLFTNGQKLTFSCRNDSTRRAFVDAAQKAIDDHATALAKQSLMGAGASLLLPVERKDMAPCVEGLTELQAKLVTAGAWTADEREAVHYAAERGRAVYKQLLEEAPADHDKLEKVREEHLTNFRGGYDWALETFVKTQDGFAEFNAQADRCASLAPPEKPRQTTKQLKELYGAGAVSALGPFKSLLDESRGAFAAESISVAPLKKMTRAIEKSMLRADAARRGEVDDILDVVRGMVTCDSMTDLGAALKFFSEADGWEIVRVKNRFAAPSSGGWADCLLNIVRSDDPRQHVCEVQLVHKKMLVLRGKDLGGHDAYNRYRTADEMLLAISGGRDVFAPVRNAVGKLKALGVVTPRTPDLPRIGAGASLKADTRAALDLAHKAVRLGDAAPSLVIAAYTCTHDAEKLRERLRELVPPDTPFVGVSSCRGVVANGQWFSSSKSKALGLWAISDDRGDYRVVHILELGDDTQQVVADRVAAKMEGRSMPQFVLCFSRLGFSEAVLKGIKSVVDASVPVFGGTAATNDTFDPKYAKWSQFSSEEERCSKNGVVLVLGWSSVEVACYMSSGFEPTEQKGVATKTSGSTILEIDGRPAMTVYDEWTRQSGEVIVGLTTGSIDTTTEAIDSELRPIGVPLDDADKEFRVLHPLSVDSATGSLTLGGSVAEGTNLTLLAAEAKTLVNNICEVSSALVKSDAQKRLGVDASSAVEECLGAFMIFCGGLVKALQDDMEERWEELADPGGKREALGMCAFGEQGPRGHGNLMVGALLFSNKPVRPTRVEPS